MLGTHGQRVRVAATTCGLFGLFLTASLAHAISYTVNPSAVGAPQDSFTASVVDFSYSSTVNQNAPAGTCTVAAPCTFTQTGTGSFSNFKSSFTDPVINTGLNHDPGYTLRGEFSGSGTAVPLPAANGVEATYTDFNLRMFADGTLVAQSTGLIAGQAHVFTDLAKGDFHIMLGIEPVGGFFTGPFVVGLNTADFAGNNTFIEGFTLGSFQNARIEGSGNLTFNVIPEPTTLLLIGSGLATLGLARRLTMR